ncbi:Protein TAR1 [Capsicum baccatum]|uniref:Protein TAR1 n=1 Tax=Capsicum baccatum TaxID=33114 RepID=A0A2G2V2R7_CAPBA|nr:Protein TAR1 [Capsicum baccatum]
MSMQCALVPWCLGATVPRRHGALVTWPHAALVPWCHGAMVPQCIGATVPWCLSATVPWHHDIALVHWCHGATMPQCHGAVVPRRHGATVPWCHGAAVPWCRGALLPWCHGAIVPWYLSALVPWRHGAKLPWCHGACVQRCHGATVPVCNDAMGQRRTPLVRTSSELAVRRAGKSPKGTVPSLSSGRHAANRSLRGSSSTSPPTPDGFGTGTPVPSPQSQSFFQTYGSILPSSLAYIVPSTGGCSPWRPDAVMSTTGCGRHSVLRIFKGRRERTGHHATCGALPAAGPYLQLSQFQGILTRFPFGARAKRAICRGFPDPLDRLTNVQVSFTWNLSPLRPSMFSFEYLLLPPRSAPTSAPLGLAPKVCSHSNPSQKIKVGRRCTPRGDPTNQLACDLWVYSPVESHTCQTPWSVFQDGSNGEPTGQFPERADTEAHRRLALPATIEETAFHEHIESLGFGRPPIYAGPRPGSIGVPARRRSTSDRGASRAPIRFPSDNFKNSLTLFSKSFSSFHHGTCSVSVSRPYLALDGIHRPIWAAFPNNPTRRQHLVV